MTSPKLETVADFMFWYAELRKSPMLTEAEWINVVASHVIELGDDLHTLVSAALIEKYGDLLARRI